MSEASTPYETAGLARRLAAMVYDGLLMFGVLFAATLVPALLLGQGPQTELETGEVVHELHPLMTGLAFQLYLLAVAGLFFSWFWHRSGQTLGMQAWRLKLVSMDGNTLGWTQCLIRVIAACLSLAALGMGYWWVLIDPQRRSWHDRLSGSRVLLLPKDNKRD